MPSILVPSGRTIFTDRIIATETSPAVAVNPAELMSHIIYAAAGIGSKGKLHCDGCLES